MGVRVEEQGLEVRYRRGRGYRGRGGGGFLTRFHHIALVCGLGLGSLAGCFLFSFLVLKIPR